MTNLELITMAIGSLKNSYSPYSNFKVDAALLCKNGNVYTGVNIENVSFSATNCAERTALFSAIAKGEKEFEKIAVVGGKDGKITDFCIPCAVCLQVMSEFCEKDFEIVLFNDTEIKTYTLGELLPNFFEM